MSQAPIKVSEDTKERIRLAAALSGRRQSEIVDAAVTEYVERNAEELALGLKNARDALFAGKTETIAYILGKDVEKVRRVSGASGAKGAR